MKSSVDRWPFLLLMLGGILLLANLGNGRLWQDEAETAVLAKNILRFGYPRAFDGVNRLNPGLPLGAGYAWTYHPWLSFYAAALFFRLLGSTTAVARLPFALMGLACLPLTYRTVRQMTGNPSLARWTSLLLCLSVPFLLHMRQCRYYAPSVLFSLWAVSAYWQLLPEGKRTGWELGTALVLLFHFNHGVFIPVVAALAAHGLFAQPDRAVRTALLRTLAFIFPLTFPFLIPLQAWQHHAAFSWKEVRHHTEFYFREINRFILPVTFWLVLLPVWRPKTEEVFGSRGSPERAGFAFTGLLLAVCLLFLVFVPSQRHFRYLIHLIPFFLLLQAALLRGLIRRRRLLGLAAFLLMTFTDLHVSGPALLGKRPVRPRCLLWEFSGELTHPYRGPVDGIVELLQREGKAGQTVKIPYGDNAVLFYTPLNVEPIPKQEDFLRPTFPEWIIPRQDWTPEEFFRSAYFSQIRGRYRQIVLDAPDIPWQNRPDPGYHRFLTDGQAPPVVVYRKIE